MTPDPLTKPYPVRPRKSQLEAFRYLAKHVTLNDAEDTVNEHMRRAFDIYLSQPAIQDALVELEKEAEPEHRPHPCTDPALSEHCSGCTDPDPLGATHQGCTIEHGHVGCELAVHIPRKARL